MKPEHFQVAAMKLADCRRIGNVVGFPRAGGPADESQAYALQNSANRLLQPRLGAIGGLKIGCTTPVMQAFLGIKSPAAGEIFASTIHQGRTDIRHKDYRKVGIECEIAVRIGTDLRPQDEMIPAADAVDGVLAAIEIVDDRYADYKAQGVHWLIADNFFNAGAVVGEAVTDWRSIDLPSLRGRTFINDDLKGEGYGESVMGHPFNALDWLIRQRLGAGQSITRGTVVLLGSLVETKWLWPGDRARIEIEQLGALEISVG